MEQLRQAAKLPGPEAHRLAGGELRISLPPHGLALLEIE
jgi:hypothetical protein